MLSSWQPIPEELFPHFETSKLLVSEILLNGFLQTKDIDFELPKVHFEQGSVPRHAKPANVQEKGSALWNPSSSPCLAGVWPPSYRLALLPSMASLPDLAHPWAVDGRRLVFLC